MAHVLICSYGVKPCYVVKDANGVTLAWLYCRDDAQRYSYIRPLNSK
jgi:hypothetical protein